MQSTKTYWSAPKGHPRIGKNLKFETPLKAALREFGEEIKNCNIRKLRKKHKYQYQLFPVTVFVNEHPVERLIGLFICRIDSSKYKLELKDRKENNVSLHVLRILNIRTKYSDACFHPLLEV